MFPDVFGRVRTFSDAFQTSLYVFGRFSDVFRTFFERFSYVFRTFSDGFDFFFLQFLQPPPRRAPGRSQQGLPKSPPRRGAKIEFVERNSRMYFSQEVFRKVVNSLRPNAWVLAFEDLGKISKKLRLVDSKVLPTVPFSVLRRI